MRRVYLDHSATTPVHPLVAEEVHKYLTGDNFGNPSSIHYYGQIACRALDQARDRVAGAIGAVAEEITFTSGGTEASNMAIHGAALTNRKRGGHIITCAVEHPATLHSVQALAEFGFHITILPVDRYGMVRIEELVAAITDETILISIMHANNEIGTIMPITEISRLIKERGNILFHVDAVQSFGKIPVNVSELGVDLLSVSGHKIYGPKGVGALYVRKGAGWRPTLFHGGAQERLRRAGTENLPGIAGFGVAAELAVNNMESDAKQQTALRDRLIKEIPEMFSHVRLTGHPEQRLPNHASFIFEFIEGESMLLSLDMKGIAASTGSACSSGSLAPSHMLLAMGIPHELAQGSLRLSLGRSNNAEDIDYFLETMAPIVARLRAMAPIKEQGDYEKYLP